MRDRKEKCFVRASDRFELGLEVMKWQTDGMANL